MKSYAPLLVVFVLVAFAACDDDSTAVSPPASSSDSAEKRTEELVKSYWLSWQKKDWDALRNTLAPDFEAGAIKGPDALVEISKSGNPWRDVTMLDATYGADSASIVYRAVDTVTGAQVQVSELLRIENGKIRRATGTFSSSPPATPSSNRPPSTLTFEPVFADQPAGARWAFVVGSARSGSSFFLRVPAGFSSPAHGHTSAYHGVVLEGAVKNGPDLASAPELTPGSYWSQKAGENHLTACVSATPCLNFITYEGPFDVVPAPR